VRAQQLGKAALAVHEVVDLPEDPKFPLEDAVQVVSLANLRGVGWVEQEMLRPPRNLFRLATRLAALTIAGRVVSPSNFVRVWRSASLSATTSCTIVVSFSGSRLHPAAAKESIGVAFTDRLATRRTVPLYRRFWNACRQRASVCEVEAGAEGLDAHLEVGECRRPYEPQLPLSFFNILSLSEHNREKRWNP
jgi:hypothetical protein